MFLQLFLAIIATVEFIVIVVLLAKLSTARNQPDQQDIDRLTGRVKSSADQLAGAVQKQEDKDHG